ncbi:cupin domain-containing protein [Sphingomonas glacialis]|uniref:Cupin domain-containing protein n=1 Tax=Sphingomonas glacialis TaxID=658225 RepID=A0A502FAS2_9SPHN|nr:quercetin 2,3-dioxygenase family protein [Sphingomonas glacialis]TPG46399.1 cupin domain-containing protein [Sphingomonas glacialis]
MTDSETQPFRPLTATAPYVLRAGEGPCHLVAGQMIRTLAGTAQTAGGFGAVVCDAPLDRGPIPMHWHEREHDTWYVTRGKLQVWCGDQSRVLTPGDFAYVAPGDTHSYQSVAPRTQFFGIVAPGGWEQFFVDAGEVWGMTGLPPADHPFDFSRMGPAMGKHRIMRVENPMFAEATPVGADDRALPGDHASYFLDAGYGTRRALFGHLSTAMLTGAESTGLVDMRLIEGGRGAAMPALRHADTHMLLYVVDGTVTVTLAGVAHIVSGGDAVNIPAGTAYATQIDSGAARWVASSAGGNGAALWDVTGSETPAFSYPLHHDAEDRDRLRAVIGIDVALAGDDRA